MADIQHWRRMIQPSRAHAPAVDHDDTDGLNPLATPKRGLKPKLSSYFSHHGASGVATKQESSCTIFIGDTFGGVHLPGWPSEEAYPQPQAEGLIDSLMCKLLSCPYESVDPAFNGHLLRIFESHRNVGDQNVQLQIRLDHETANKQAIVEQLQQAQKQWADEKQQYKAEVKRLELLLANGKRGLAEVTLARQDSTLRSEESKRRSKEVDDGLETIFEFLEKTKRYEDKAWSSQRGEWPSC